MSDPTTASLQATCHSGDPVQAAKAIDELRLMDAKHALHDVVREALSPYVVVRSAVVSALGTLGRNEPEIAGPALLDLLADTDDYVRAEAADGLGIIGYAPAVPQVLHRLRNDTNSIVRAASAETLGDLGAVDAIPDLIGALSDSDRAVRGYAANSLGLLGTAEIVPVLEMYAAGETSPATRGELLGALYRLGAGGALASLIQLLNEADASLAVNLLNTIDDLASRPPPLQLTADAPAVIDALNDLRRRLPSVAEHASAVSARLSAVTNRGAAAERS
jgi:HEAT repeat protein